MGTADLRLSLGGYAKEDVWQGMGGEGGADRSRRVPQEGPAQGRTPQAAARRTVPAQTAGLTTETAREAELFIGWQGHQRYR